MKFSYIVGGLIGALFVVLLAFSGHYQIAEAETDVEDFKSVFSEEIHWYGPGRSKNWVTVVTDNVTGCQYLYRASGGLTLRLDANGKPMCGVAP